MSSGRKPGIQRQSSRPAVLAQQSEHKSKIAVVWGGVIGIAFGFLLEKSKVALPQIIRGQMQFNNFVMMEVFLAASATGTLSAYLLKYLGVQEKRVASATALGFGLMQGYGANIVGGMVMGSGMVVGGACPGTAAAATGGGVWTGAFVMAGGVFSAMAFAHFSDFSKKMKKGFHSKSMATLVDDALGRTHFEVAVGFTAALAVAILMVDKYFPWQEGYKAAFPEGFSPNFSLSFTADAWAPYIAGALIGSLQVPSFLFLDRYLGASSCYVTTACAVESVVKRHDASVDTPYYKSFFTFTDYAQLGTVIGIGLGAFLSARLSSVHLDTVPWSPQTALQSFVGGFILLFGARLAGGCASGHGLSGMARLSWASFLTVGGMFAGGGLTAYLLL